MKPVEVVIKHRDRILAEHALGGSTWRKIHNTLSGDFPEVAEMNPSTFKQYALTMVELNKKLNNKDSGKVEQELNRLQELNSELNKQIELNKLNTDKVEQELNRQIRLNTGLNNSIEKLNSQLNKQGLNMDVKQGKSKQKLNIAGWSIQESKGYYRGFRKIAGKVQGVYLGKDLNDAETKIKAKEMQMAGGDPG